MREIQNDGTPTAAAAGEKSKKAAAGDAARGGISIAMNA